MNIHWFVKCHQERGGSTLLVGVNYNKEDKKHSSRIEEWGKRGIQE
ncbi:MAG: hypothetical protein K2O16_19070 [Lachnospiraceae bacterium]|nr:hypothetical protein [Lachnospiraceae bacterium]